MDKITKSIEMSKFYVLARMIAIFYILLSLGLLAIASMSSMIKFPVFLALVSILLIAIISLVMIEIYNKRNVENLKKEYKELEVKDEKCEDILNFYENGTFLEGPEFGDRIIIIHISSIGIVKGCKIFKENVKEIFKEKE